MVLAGVFFLLGLAGLVKGADWLVDGAAKIALRFNVSPLLIGLTLVALGTSAPELAVSVRSALIGEPDIAIGNVVGSNIANILLVLGAAAVFAPLTVRRKIVRIEVPIMIAVSLLFFAVVQDGSLGNTAGLILGGALIAFLVFLFSQARQNDPGTADEFDLELDSAHPKLVRTLFFVLAGTALLLAGSHFLVMGATEIASRLGVSELLIGLTIVAVGTSAPELAASITAAIKGDRDIAIGNAIGSNIMNLLVVIPACALISQETITINPQMIRFDIPLMIAVAVLCLPIFIDDFRVKRWEGIVFLASYGVYTIYLILLGMDHRWVDHFPEVPIFIALPILVSILVTAVTWRNRRARYAELKSIRRERSRRR